MEYRFSKDPLFGKYCYIDTPWIAGKNTIYRIVNSGVRSNAWVEVPISGRGEVVLHDHQEDVIFVVLDTLISEDSRIKKVALKDVEIADTPQIDEFKNFDREDLILLIECQKERIGELLADKDTPQTEKVDRIPFDPLVEMDIKRAVEERLRQTEAQIKTQNSNLTFEKQTDCPWR